MGADHPPRRRTLRDSCRTSPARVVMRWADVARRPSRRLLLPVGYYRYPVLAPDWWITSEGHRPRVFRITHTHTMCVPKHKNERKEKRRLGQLLCPCVRQTPAKGPPGLVSPRYTTDCLGKVTRCRDLDSRTFLPGKKLSPPGLPRCADKDTGPGPV